MNRLLITTKDGRPRDFSAGKLVVEVGIDKRTKAFG
jgi:hypothetical protein